MADDAFKRQVLDATDIVELVSQSVALKRRGKNYVGLCPFHNEKTPSFHVSPERRYFKCFGCKEAGNAIDFVMKRDRLDFLSALRFLAERAGLELPRRGGRREDVSERQLLFDACAKAADRFHANLLHPELGKPARDYLASRGFTPETLQRFRIGYAPPGWDHLLKSHELSAFPTGLLALAGLVKPNHSGTGHYDTFRNRIIFPIRDEQGRVVAFGGRHLPLPPSPAPTAHSSADPTTSSDLTPGAPPAKYLNSPETPIFSKARIVFGLDAARQRIVETRTAAVVEGYTDVVIAHQCGATNVVSVLGTALTEHHLTLLRRFADKLVLVFDGDAAGETAVNRSIELFLSQPIEIAIATLPAGTDPDEFLLKHGTTAFDELLQRAVDALTFKWRLLERQVRDAPDNLTARQSVVDDFLRLILQGRETTAVDPIRWGQVLRRVERLTEVPLNLLLERVRTLTRSRGAAPRRVARGDSAGRSARGGGAIRELSNRYASTAESPAGPLEPASADARSGADRNPDEAVDTASTSACDPSDASGGAVANVPAALRRAERWILGILLARPSEWLHVQVKVSPSDFTDPRLRALAEVYWEHQRNEGEPTFDVLLSALPTPALRTLATELLEECETLPNPAATLTDAVKYCEEERGRQTMARRLATLSPGKEDAQKLELLRELSSRSRQPDLRRIGPQ